MQDRLRSLIAALTLALALGPVYSPAVLAAPLVQAATPTPAAEEEDPAETPAQTATETPAAETAPETTPEPTEEAPAATATVTPAEPVTSTEPVTATEPASPAESVPVIGYFESDVLPAASSPGLQIALTLYDDGTARVVSDYLNDEPPIVELGTWVQNDDGSVTLTVTGTPDREYSEPIELTFELGDDGSLTVPGEEGGPFGTEGLTLAPAEIPEPGEPAETGTLTETAEITETAEVTETAEITETAEMTETAAVTGAAGVFISPVLPAADAPGLVIMAILYENGDAMVSSYYLNGNPPIVEVGTWGAGVDGAVTVTATGTLERTYDQPTAAEFELAADGSLTAGSVTLARLPEIAQAAAPAAPPAVAAPQTGPAVVARYQTEVMPAASSPGLQITLTLYEDESAQMVSDYLNGEAPFIDLGTWSRGDEGTLTLTLTGSPEGDYDQPVTLAFDVEDDGALVATDYPVEVFGEAGLVFAPAPLEESGAAPQGAAEEGSAGGSVTGRVYQSEVLPAASSPGRQITLALAEDGVATMGTDYQNDEPPVTELGEWEANDDGTLTVTLTEGPQGVYDEPQTIVFTVNDDGSLSATEYDETVYGSEGLELAPMTSE